MYFDIISKCDKGLVERLQGLGFEKVLVLESGRLHECEKEGFELKVYGGNDTKIVVQKHKADAITDLETNDTILDKGLCSKLKEANMFVIFKLKNLLESAEFFRTYKNIVINAKLCYDHGVDCMFVSFSSDYNEAKAPMQLIAFAEQMGYRFDRVLKSYSNIEKRL